MKPIIVLWIALVAVFPHALPAQQVASSVPPVCGNRELLEAIRIIKSACDERSCNFEQLKELDSAVDKPTLLAALQSPYLRPVHIFFPINKTEVADALDWTTIKRDQLLSLRLLDDPDRAVVFVLGRASAIGGYDKNILISQARMANVMKFLKSEVLINCKVFHGAWFGKTILQLYESDASLLNIPPRDFREDGYVLNQSVHVFVFPCGELIRF